LTSRSRSIATSWTSGRYTRLQVCGAWWLDHLGDRLGQLPARDHHHAELDVGIAARPSWQATQPSR
jgi:hypothetical protein